MVASWGIEAALKALPEALPRAEEVTLDGRALLFMLIASVLTGILFGLAPALKNSRRDFHQVLGKGGRGLSGARHRTQRVFVIVEIALALVLLSGAGLMIRSLVKLWGIDPGFDPHNVLAFSTSSPPSSSPDALRSTWRQMQDALAGLPGIQAASLKAGSTPMGEDAELPFWIDGEPKPLSQTQMRITQLYLVQPDYLNIMRIPLKHGRFLTTDDNEHAPSVTVIDDRFARLYFGNRSPIGKRINFDILNSSAEIVGVVGHVKQWGLDEDSTAPFQAQCYLALTQLPDKFMPLVAKGVGVAVRTGGPPLAEVGTIRHAPGGDR